MDKPITIYGEGKYADYAKAILDSVDNAKPLDHFNRGYIFGQLVAKAMANLTVSEKMAFNTGYENAIDFEAAAIKSQVH